MPATPPPREATRERTLRVYAEFDYGEKRALAGLWTSLTSDQRTTYARRLDTTTDHIERQSQMLRKLEAERAAYEQRLILAEFGAVDAPESTIDTLATAPALETVALPEYPASPSPEWTDYLEIDCDNAIIIADVELPDYDAQLMRAAHAVAQKHDIRTLIIGGDYAALDSVSAWKHVYKAGGTMGLRQELRFAEQVADVALTWFDDVYAIMGNHEWRLGTATGGELEPYDIIRTKHGEIQVRPYDYLYLNTSQGRVMVVHPSGYSRIPLKVPQAILATEEPRCHVLSTHTHHSASGYDASGKYELMEIGCLRDPKRTQYKTQRRTTHPQWVQGFAVIKDGYRHRLTKIGTDWRMWLGDDLYAEVFGATLGRAA